MLNAPQVLVIGDVSANSKYHLGDEAMTEVAITELLKRNIAVTLVAGDPSLSQDFYGVPCVLPLGFAACTSHSERELRLKELVHAFVSPSHPDHSLPIFTAVRNADAVVIAGGGNLNSSGIHHIYERLALKRFAERAGIPLIISSQTVGPQITTHELALVTELSEYASVFGAREDTTAALMRRICASGTHIVRTVDDAMLLRSETSPPNITLPKRFILCSFTFHPGHTGLTSAEYYQQLAARLDQLALATDADILLLPHIGKLGVPKQTGETNDVFGHDQIVKFSTLGRTTSLPLMSARELLAITQNALFTISSRYHPLVFAGALGVPAIGIAQSYYSSIRMRGALQSLGAESFAIPYEHWDAFIPAITEKILADLPRYQAAFSSAGRQQIKYQEQWWDGIARVVSGSGQPHITDVTIPAPLTWATEIETSLLNVARASHESFTKFRMNNQNYLRVQSQRVSALEHQLNELRELYAEMKRTKKTRFFVTLRQRLQQIRQRM